MSMLCYGMKIQKLRHLSTPILKLKFKKGSVFPDGPLLDVFVNLK